ncbi:MAG: RNA polymerase sigma factor [Gammaproteobacteria bacterium]|nr:RNA polymerase sigma factor [Gammaproteobacteria bacterium]
MNDAKEKSFNEWLVINSQLGDKSAFEQLLERWQPRLLAYATRRLGDRELAREVVQECLMGITRGLTRLRDPAAFPGWCYKLLERRCIDAIRTRIRDRQKLSELVRQQPESDTDQRTGAVQLEQQVSIQQAVAQLDSNLAAVLKLYYQESFTIEEIAEVLEIPAGTVKSRLYYARKTLAAILEE